MRQCGPLIPIMRGFGLREAGLAGSKTDQLELKLIRKPSVPHGVYKPNPLGSLYPSLPHPFKMTPGSDFRRDNSADHTS